MYAKKEKIYPAYISKHNSDCEKQVILLMIPNGEGCHYLEVKILSTWLRGITSKRHSDFQCVNCLHSFAAKNNKGNSMKKYVKKKIFATL